MRHDNNASQLGPFEHGIIRKKVKQIIGRAGFREQDREDLEHDLVARLLLSLKSFDPNRAHRNVFVTAVVERDVANILGDKKAEKRDYRRIASLNVVIEVTEDGPTELADTISDREYNARRGRHVRAEQEMAELRIDVTECVDELKDALQDVCERLKQDSISQVARDLGVPRTTLTDRIRKLRLPFEEQGLKDYL